MAQSASAQNKSKKIILIKVVAKKNNRFYNIYISIDRILPVLFIGGVFM